jgi:ParB-like chromosome segregation protein Spo0J
MKLDSIKQPEKNVRIHTEQQLREFERSVQMFGQIRPIVIDENNMILAGNGLYETLRRMGIDSASVYKMTDLTQNQKKKLMIADNKIFSLGIDNLDTLNTFLEDLHNDLDIPGYDSEILRQMVSEAEQITEKLSEYGTVDDEEIRSMKNRNAEVEQDTTENSENSAADERSDQQQDSDPEQAEETGEIKRFVLCPKCGEKIWL